MRKPHCAPVVLSIFHSEHPRQLAWMHVLHRYHAKCQAHVCKLIEVVPPSRHILGTCSAWPRAWCVVAAALVCSQFSHLSPGLLLACRSPGHGGHGGHGQWHLWTLALRYPRTPPLGSSWLAVAQPRLFESYSRCSILFYLHVLFRHLSIKAKAWAFTFMNSFSRLHADICRPFQNNGWAHERPTGCSMKLSKAHHSLWRIGQVSGPASHKETSAQRLDTIRHPHVNMSQKDVPRDHPKTVTH